jgi:hypothetical protein
MVLRQEETEVFESLFSETLILFFYIYHILLIFPQLPLYYASKTTMEDWRVQILNILEDCWIWWALILVI